MARILTGRIEMEIEVVLRVDEFQFRRGKGAIDALGVLRII
jgi:hypothetical protein